MEKLTSRHFSLLVIAATGASILNYPSLFIRLGGRDTWIFSIISSVIFLAFSICIFIIIKRTKSYDFKAICLTALGKILGTVFLFIYSLILLLVCIESASVSATAIHTNIFIHTPIWYCLLLFVLTAFFVSKNRFNSILMVTVSSMFVVIAISILIGVLNQRYADFSMLKPILHDKSISNYTIAVLSQLGSLSSFIILLPILERIDDRKNLNKYTFGALIFIFIAVTWFMINILSSLGPLRGSNIFFPQFIQAQRIYFGGFIENGELFIIITSTLFWIVKYILAMFSLYTLWREKITNKIIFIGLASFIVYLISYILSKNTYGLFNILYYYQFILVGGLLILPLIVYIIYNFRFKHTSKSK